ncbi:GMC family oxidoreductase [Cystobacter fuscus]|uniref:GMC family oxidoreductase n=1 Tax=Cystobacter fuscus TaxID=43 RepID=UPI0012DD8314|nr:GMC family oxidoreductase N-terminal domain-containing protein [Cystobacter fuscus]
MSVTPTSGGEPRRGAEHHEVLARHFDYVIVGGGTAGCVLARRLVEGTDATVLLLEAGGSDEGVASLSDPLRWIENIGSPHAQTYFYEPSPHVAHRSILLSRGRVLGGSGSTNALIWARGNRADYDGWAEAGNVGWDYDSVLPLFKKSEDWEDGASDLRGAGGPIRVERARNLHPVAAALIDAGGSYGMPYLDDVNVPHPEGVGPINMNVRAGERCGTSRAYLRPVMHDEKLTVLTGAQVLSLTLSGTRCTGLEFLREGERRSVGASREVILCAGAIDTPRLLLLSGIGPAEELERLGIPVVAALPGVGQNLQEHIIVAGLCFEAKQSLMPLNNNLVGSTFHWKSRSELRVPDLMFVSVQIPYVSAEIGARYPIPANSFCIAPGLVRVQSRGYLRMKTARHDGPLEIQPNLLSEQADVDALLTGLELGLDIASQPAFRELTRSWVAPTKRMSREESVAFLRQACSPYFHPVGTCAMGSGEDAVVDARLRVHGIEGLRISDASIMPTIPSAGTHAPSVMIGEFASRLLLGG